jgi:hypothetical protein
LSPRLKVKNLEGTDLEPKRDCTLVPSLHALDMMTLRGIPFSDFARLVRAARWRPERGERVDAVYERWHLKLKLVPCHILLITAFQL